MMLTLSSSLKAAGAVSRQSVMVVADHSLRLYQVSGPRGEETLKIARCVEFTDGPGAISQALTQLLEAEVEVQDLLIILREPLYRSQVEFLPQTARRNALKALTALARLGAHEYPIIEKLATTTRNGATTQAWQLSVVQCDLVDELKQELNRRDIKARKILLDHELSRAAAGVINSAQKENSDTVLVSVTEQSLELIYLTNGTPAFSRRMAVSDAGDLGKRVASELRRTNVFFHRKFPSATVDRALVVTQPGISAESVVTEILSANRIASVEVIPTRAILGESNLSVVSADLASLGWVAEIRSRRLNKLVGVDTPASRQSRSRRRFAPLLTAAIVIFSSLSAFYQFSLNANLTSHRMLLASRAQDRDRATVTIKSWQSARLHQESVVARAKTLDQMLATQVDLVEVLQGIARQSPEGVKVESFEILPSSSEGDPSATPESWAGRIVFVTARNYFEARELIHSTAQSLGKCDFLVGADTRVDILEDSLPWKEAAFETHGNCRFVIHFRTRRS